MQKIDYLSFCPVFIQGSPQVQRRTALKEVEAISGRDVELKMEVCSDPIPSKSTWDWGQAQVEAGQVLFLEIYFSAARFSRSIYGMYYISNDIYVGLGRKIYC